MSAFYFFVRWILISKFLLFLFFITKIIMERHPVWFPRYYSVQAICCRACSSFIADESRGVGEDVWNLLFCALDIHNVRLIQNELICYCGVRVGSLVNVLFGDYCYDINQNFFVKTLNEGNEIVRAMTAQVNGYPAHGFYGCFRCNRPFVACEILPIMTIGGLQFKPFDCANLQMRRGLNVVVQRHLICLCSNVVGEIFGTLNAVLYSDYLVNFFPNGGHNPFGIWVTVGVLLLIHHAGNKKNVQLGV